MERESVARLKQQNDRDMSCVCCPKCGGQWFEEVHFARYKEDHNLVLGQAVPERPSSISYIFLRCALCSNLVEPHIMTYGRDIGRNDYSNLLDTLEGKHDERLKKKKVTGEEV